MGVLAYDGISVQISRCLLSFQSVFSSSQAHDSRWEGGKIYKLINNKKKKSHASAHVPALVPAPAAPERV